MADPTLFADTVEDMARAETVLGVDLRFLLGIIL